LIAASGGREPINSFFGPFAGPALRQLRSSRYVKDRCAGSRAAIIDATIKVWVGRRLRCEGLRLGRSMGEVSSFVEDVSASVGVNLTLHWSGHAASSSFIVGGNRWIEIK
jgi:hypothetical protein